MADDSNPTPVSNVSGRAEALEEAAVLVEAQWNHCWPSDIAAAIRALKDSPLSIVMGLEQQIEAAREFVKRHPALTLIDLAEFEGFLKIPAMMEAALPFPAPKDTPQTIVGGSAEDFATRLFDLEGFMLLEAYKGKPAVTVTFPDQRQAEQFHLALVDLSQHRRPERKP